jgi:hypothetical protein
MEEARDSIQTLNNDFSVLTEENRKSVIEMTKFLIITQNTIVPELLHLDKEKLKEEQALTNDKRTMYPKDT